MRASSIDHRIGPEATEVAATRKPIWQRLLDRAIDLFLVLWLFTGTAAVIPLLVVGNRDMTAPDEALLRMVSIAPCVLIGPFLIVSRARAITALLVRNPVLLALLLWAWCSILWSVAPEISLRRVVSLTVYTLLGCYLVIRHDFEWILEKLAWLCLALLLTTLAFIFFLPSLVFMPEGNGLRAIFVHKNSMGDFLKLIVVLLPTAMRMRVVHPALGSATLLIALALLVPVNSATAIVAVVLILATHVAIASWALPARFAALATAWVVALGCLLIVAVWANLDAIFELLGRDATFTGRVDLWQYAWQMIQARPLTGYGYQAFFAAERFSAYVMAVFPWDPGSAHQGYLEILLSLGLVGLALFMVFLVSGLVRAALARNHELIVVLSTFLIGYTVPAFSESTLLGQSSIEWVLLVIFTMSATPGLAAIRSR